MSDLQLLVCILVLVYGWECACWLRRGAVGFLTAFGRKWRVAHPATLLGNQQGGFIFANPLPPLGMVLTGNPFPLSLSPEGMLAFVAPSINPGSRPAQTGKLLRFEEVRTVAASGRKLKVNGAVVVKAGSPTYAQHLADQLRHLTEVPVDKRAKAIEELFAASFDTKLIERRWGEFIKTTRPVRLLANGLFLYLFIFAPLIIWSFGLRQSWVGLLAGLVALTLTLSILFRRAHRNYYPKAEDERFTHSLTVLLSPATAIRAYDGLSRPLVEEFHPLAIAKVLCAPDQFRRFAQRVLREVRHPALPTTPGSEPLAARIEQNSRALLLRTIEEFLKTSGLDPEELCHPPTPIDETCRSFCPHCLEQFTTQQGLCADCGGLPTIAFTNPASIDTPAVCAKR